MIRAMITLGDLHGDQTGVGEIQFGLRQDFRNLTKWLPRSSLLNIDSKHYYALINNHSNEPLEWTSFLKTLPAKWTIL